MKHSIKNSKGKFITRKQHERTILRRAGIFAGSILLATVFGIASHMTQQVDASNTMTDDQLCSLHAVVCDGEATTTLEVYEVVDVPSMSPFEVAMHFIDQDTEFMEIFSPAIGVLEDEDYEKLQEFLKERQAYARAVGIKEYHSIK